MDREWKKLEPGSESWTITRIKKGIAQTDPDRIALEVPLTIFVNDRELLSFLCSPTDPVDLALGFFWSEGLIRSKEDVDKVFFKESKGQIFVTLAEGLEVDEESLLRGRAVTSGCARGTTFHRLADELDLTYVDSDASFAVSEIMSGMKSLRTISPLYKETGCVHVCAVAGHAGKLLMIREDIGRHNAVDKIFGACLQDSIAIDDKMMLLSGRISSEMVVKAIRCRVPVLASRAAPTSAAVRIADEFGLTLAGFARGERINVYTRPDRIRSG